MIDTHFDGNQTLLDIGSNNTQYILLHVASRVLRLLTLPSSNELMLPKLVDFLDIFLTQTQEKGIISE